MPLIQPALSSRRGAFRDHYHGKTRVNMPFHDTSQQPARPAGVSGRSAAAGTAATGSKGPALSIVMPAPHIVMPAPISSCPDLFRASPSTASPRAAAWIPGTSPGMTEEPVLSLSKGASGHDGGRRRPEPRPARAGPARTDPDSADRRGASCACLARAQSGARTAPAPTRARARTQMRAIKGRSDAGPASSNASRTKGAAAPHAHHPACPLPPQATACTHFISACLRACCPCCTGIRPLFVVPAKAGTQP